MTITKLIFEFAGFTRVEHKSYPRNSVPSRFSLAIPSPSMFSIPMIEEGEHPPFRRLDFRLDYIGEDRAYYKWDGRLTV